jgi:hypothetical protein
VKHEPVVEEDEEKRQEKLIEELRNAGTGSQKSAIELKRAEL